MPKYVVNPETESEMTILAGHHKSTDVLTWFYDPQGNAIVCLKNSFIDKLEELPA